MDWRSMRVNSQSGHVVAEWVVTTFLLTVVLFMPLPGLDKSLVALMMEAIRNFYANNTYLLSLP